MNVTATYPIFSPNTEFIGFSAAGIDLYFFQKWLNNISDPNVTISILDKNQILLARKPISQNIGESVYSDIVNNFLQTSNETINFKVQSSIDNIDRIGSLRKIRNLPFMVAVNYPYEQILSKWYTKLLIYIIGCVILVGISLFSAVVYYKNRCNALHLKKLLSELQKSAEQHQSILQTAMDGFWITDTQGQLLEVSETYCQMSGYSEKELLEMRIADVETIDTTDDIASRIQDIIKKGAGRFQSKHKRKNGSVFDVEVSVQYREEDGGRFVCFLRDITERKKAVEPLTKSESRFKEMFEQSPFGIALISSLTGHIYALNPKFAKISGRTIEEMKGGDWMSITHPDDVQEDLDNMALLNAGKINGFDMDKRYIRPDGSHVWINMTIAPVAVEDKTQPRHLCMIEDITAQKEAVEERKQLQDKLQRAQKMEAMGLMAGGVAHDLNNILSGVVSLPELLLMNLPEDSPFRKPIKTIQESGMRAADVVEDLMTIARGVASSKEPLNFNTMVEEYLESAEHLKLERTHSFVSFKTELDPTLLNMNGSPTHIKKILMNLIANASEAIEGSGTVTISTLSQYLDMPLKGYEDVRTGEYTMLAVSDDGSGISPGDLERVFEPFYTKKVMGRAGTGLGLAVVWNTTQDYNGYHCCPVNSGVISISYIITCPPTCSFA